MTKIKTCQGSRYKIIWKLKTAKACEMHHLCINILWTIWKSGSLEVYIHTIKHKQFFTPYKVSDKSNQRTRFSVTFIILAVFLRLDLHNCFWVCWCFTLDMPDDWHFRNQYSSVFSSAWRHTYHSFVIIHSKSQHTQNCLGYYCGKMASIYWGPHLFRHTLYIHSLRGSKGQYQAMFFCFP